MENTKLKFKTNLNCGGCVSKVQADFDETVGKDKWQVDIAHPEKTLTVQVDSSEVSVEKITEIVKSKGFTIELVGE